MTGRPAATPPALGARHLPGQGSRVTRWRAWPLLTTSLLAAWLLGGCMSLPLREPAPVSQAHASPETTALGRLFSAGRPAGEPTLSGFRLLASGESALATRLSLALQAEHTLDVQAFLIDRDDTGLTLLRALRDAAARGVRVRLLLDDYRAAELMDLLEGLAAHDNVAVRLFNPLSLRDGAPLLRLLLSRGSFEVNNHRMHNKLWIADSAVAVFGGRNLADAYFMQDPAANFIDLDLLGSGPVARDLATGFDAYWNSPHAWPLQAVRTPSGTNADRRNAFDQASREFAAAPTDTAEPPPAARPGTDPLAGRPVLHWASARVHVDSPAKVDDPVLPHRATPAMRGVLEAIDAARHQVVIASPYVVPGPIGMQALRSAAARGLRIAIYTNSLGATDEPLVHIRYAAYRRELLRLGVALYELDPQLTRQARRFGGFGLSTPRLHAKALVVDGQLVLAGSANFDMRSAVGNTEISVAVNSPRLADEVATLLGSDGQAGMRRLRLAADGQTIEWVHVDAQGHELATRNEPHGNAWLRLKLWLQSLLVDDSLL